jgi:hypothetical protein
MAVNGYCSVSNILYDKETGTQTKFVDNDKDGVSVEVTQDVTGIMDSIAQMRAQSFNPKAIGRIAGQIPILLYEKWGREFNAIHGVQMLQADAKTRQRFLASKLNSSEYSRLRVWEGKL